MNYLTIIQRIIFFVLLFSVSTLNAQIHLDQNGLKTSVSGIMSANETQPMRFEISTIGYNSYHWQTGGLIIIELFNQFYGTGYEKYIVENGFVQGINIGSPVLKLVETHGFYHNARIVLGTSYNLSSSFGGYTNKALPIYLDLREYSKYKVRITYLQDKVDQLSNLNQILINTNPSGTPIAEFSVSTILDPNITSNGILSTKGAGTHSIENGSLAIGTTNSQGYKLAVAGGVIAESIKVKTQAAWPDYVFNKKYTPETLKETEKYINKNGHLPGIPSAMQVKTEGIDLAEMNIKLLEKIEELTLHLIAKEKVEDIHQQEFKALQNEFIKFRKKKHTNRN